MYIAFVIGDNWHFANGKHFGDHINLVSTGRPFANQIDAITTAFNELKDIYKNAEVVSKKGLKADYHNELDVDGRQFDIYCIKLQ